MVLNKEEWKQYHLQEHSSLISGVDEAIAYLLLSSSCDVIVCRDLKLSKLYYNSVNIISLIQYKFLL